MSLPLHTPTRLSIRLEARHNIVLDLVRGLRNIITFCVHNGEDKAVTLTIPGFKVNEGPDNYTPLLFDLQVALAQGIFEFRELGTGSSISLDNLKLADTEAPQPTYLVIPPGRTIKCFLLHPGSREICQIGLRAWESYVLGFNNSSERIKCRFSTPEEEAAPFKVTRGIPTETSYTDGQERSALLETTGHPIQIQVVPGIPLPRFQVSIQLSSNICNLSGSPSFSVRLVLKSLERRPVTVYLEGHPIFLFHEPKFGFAFSDAATDEEIEFPKVDEDSDPRYQKIPKEGYFCFTEGSEWTHEFKLEKRDLECLKPDRTYEVKLYCFNFARWRYGELSDPQAILEGDKIERDVVEPEMVEAAPTFASIVEKTMEVGGTGHFRRLPRELRNMVYKNLEATEPNVLYFRTEAGP